MIDTSTLGDWHLSAKATNTLTLGSLNITWSTPHQHVISNTWLSELDIIMFDSMRHDHT